MKFRKTQLIIDGEFLDLKGVQQIKNAQLNYFQHASNFYRIEIEIIEKRFMWIYCQYDNSEIYSSTVWNSIEQKDERNPRQKSQIECRYQLFICYDTDKKLLYLNDYSKKGFIKAYLTEIFSKAVTIKNLYSSFEDFKKVVRTLKSIKFIQHNSIVNNTNNRGSLFEQICNVYGCDAPDEMCTVLKYSNIPINDKFHSLFSKLQKGRGIGEFENIVIVGEDVDGIEQSFDFTSIISSQEIKAIKDDDGHFKNDEVQSLLLEQIR